MAPRLSLLVERWLRVAGRVSRQQRQLVTVISVLLLLVIFLLDLVSPLGVAVYALFAVVVLLSVLARVPGLVMMAAVAASALIVFGLLISPYDHVNLRLALVNRGLALVTVWSTVLLAMAIERGRRRLEQRDAQLQRLVREDPLTGVANRRRFTEDLSTECQRAVRDRSPVSLIMIDIDHFKEYNDRWGHPRGDECLRQIAAAIDSQIHRPGDLLARYGGEEFVVLLPATGPAGALARAESIRRAVEAMGLKHPQGGVVTISLGVATAGPRDTAPVNQEALLAAADRALYRAKNAGRNRVEPAETTA